MEVGLLHGDGCVKVLLLRGGGYVEVALLRGGGGVKVGLLHGGGGVEVGLLRGGGAIYIRGNYILPKFGHCPTLGPPPVRVGQCPNSAFLKDSSEKRNKNETLKELVKQIRDVVYEAENTVDTFVAQAAVDKSRQL
ncbi:NBS-LRR class resistance protein Fy2-Ry2 [Forsythia ovata]|uniref:NBS-LRR class resistance protein Fy2-Ry2 n=1 Tax=Forsythia ovata TaxID=205694 RepID=A0ABD1PL83_9LAMI